MMEWESDTGLQIQIVATLAFVLALPFAFAYTFLYLLNTVGLKLLELLLRNPGTDISTSIQPSSLAG